MFPITYYFFFCLYIPIIYASYAISLSKKFGLFWLKLCRFKPIVYYSLARETIDIVGFFFYPNIIGMPYWRIVMQYWRNWL